jgi:dTDP-4-amino-4,6-dideoxygalactose transaminase
MPAFHCGLEIQAARDAGWEVRFYRVMEDLSVDEEDLRHRFRSEPGPVYLIHYFGFPQPGLYRISAMCRERSLPLIEDCAHSLFSAFGSVPLGSVAPLAVFSLGKTLGALGGGALRADQASLEDWTGQPFLAPPPLPFSIRPDLDILRTAAKRRIARVRRPFCESRPFGEGIKTSNVGSSPSDQGPVWTPFGERKYDWPISVMARRLFAGTEVGQVVSRRRSNWSSLHSLLADKPRYEPVHRVLPDGCCPLVLAVRTRSRKRLRRLLGEHGIDPYAFGASPHLSLPESEVRATARVRDRILGLPVHQGLGSSDVEFIAEATAAALGELSSAGM